MVRIKGSKGVVDVKLVNMANVLRFLRKKGQDIKDGSDLGTFRAANFVQEEVQQSILGNRAEAKSVATGRLADSISLNKVEDSHYVVFPRRISYPGGQTTEDVAKIIEFSPSIKGGPRRHFENTKDRTKDKVRKEIQRAIKLASKI